MTHQAAKFLVQATNVLCELPNPSLSPIRLLKIGKEQIRYPRQLQNL